MQLLNYALAIIVCYIGLFVGMILIFMGPEEKKEGIKYFIIMQTLVLSLILIFLFPLHPIISSVLFCLFGFLIFKKIQNQYLVYSSLALILFLSLSNNNLFIIESSLIFIYGLPTGSLLTKKKKVESLKNILRYSHFILIALFVWYIF